VGSTPVEKEAFAEEIISFSFIQNRSTQLWGSTDHWSLKRSHHQHRGVLFELTTQQNRNKEEHTIFFYFEFRTTRPSGRQRHKKGQNSNAYSIT
jgi:hypothetical protein